MGFDFDDQDVREIRLSDIRGLEARHRAHLVEVARVFDEAPAYAESPKNHVQVKVTIELTYDIDTKTGSRRLEYMTSCKTPKRIGGAQPLYRRGGKFQIANEATQLEMGDVVDIADRGEDEGNQGESDSPAESRDAAQENE